MRSLVLEANEKKATAIRAARESAEKLVIESEDLRKAIDDLDGALNKLAALSCLAVEDRSKIDRIRNRLQMIRQSRNGMECFALKCWLCESLDKAWKELL